MAEDTEYTAAAPESRLNKYEMVIVAAKEARRLNEMARTQGRELKRRVTHLAMDRFVHGEVKFKYED